MVYIALFVVLVLLDIANSQDKNKVMIAINLIVLLSSLFSLIYSKEELYDIVKLNNTDIIIAEYNNTDKEVVVLYDRTYYKGVLKAFDGNTYKVEVPEGTIETNKVFSQLNITKEQAEKYNIDLTIKTTFLYLITVTSFLFILGVFINEKNNTTSSNDATNDNKSI